MGRERLGGDVNEVGRSPVGRLLYVFNSPRFFLSHRLEVARAARAAGWEIAVACPEDAGAVESLRREGFEWIGLEVPRGARRPDLELQTFASLGVVLHRLRPDLVELATIRPVLYGSLATRMLGLPTVCWVPGLGHVFLRRGLLARAVALGYRVAWSGSRPLSVLLENPQDLEELVSLGALPRNVARVAPGSAVRLDLFAPAPEPGGPPTVLFVGRMLREKGLGEFIEAARLVQAARPGVRFLLAGSPDPANPSSVSESTLREWSGWGRVQWLGQRDDIPRLLADCHVVCLPSWREGRPQVLLEAAAAGRPAVATNVPGSRDVVRDGETGLLVPVRDAGALAGALIRLCNDPAMRSRMGAAARRVAEAHFGVPRMVGGVLEVYRQVVASGRGTSRHEAD